MSWRGMDIDDIAAAVADAVGPLGTQVYGGGISAEAARAAVRESSRVTASGATSSRRRKKRKVGRAMDPAYWVGQFYGYKGPKISKYEKYGCIQDAETYGQNSMNDCNYIGCASVVPRHMAYSCGVSLIRYIAYKHFKLEYKSLSDPISPDVIVSKNGGASGNDFQAIGFYNEGKYYDRSTGAINGPTVSELSIFQTFENDPTPRAKTVHDFATYFADLIVNSNSFIASHSDYVRLKYYKIFGENFGGVASESRTFVLDTLKFKLFSTSSFSIQNSTKSDDSSTSTDVINSNPVKGKCFVFNGLEPKWREDANNSWGAFSRPDAWSWTQADGVHMVNGNPELAFKMVPSDTLFRNLDHKYPLFLNPGEIKTKHNIDYYAELTINQFIKLYNTNANTNNSMGSYARTPGNLHMFVLEQVVRTGTQPIVLNYQQYRRWGSYVIPPKRQYMPRQVLSITEANHPA